MAEAHVNIGVNVDVNVELKRLLMRAGWTPEDLGDQLNRLAASMRLRAHINRQSVRRWVHAMPSCPKIVKPSEPWPALVCHLLQRQTRETVTPAALGWSEAALCLLAADHGLDQPWTRTGALDAWAQVMDAGPMGFQRRHFFELTGLTLTTVAYQWLRDPDRVAASLAGKRVDHALVDGFDLLTEARRRMDDAIGGGNLLTSVREDLQLVLALLDNAAYTEDIGRRLHAVAAELGRLAGWLAFDTNQHAAAQRYWLAALRSAHLSGDRALGANILRCMSEQAARVGSPRDAFALAEAALDVEQALTPAVTASLYGQLAVGAGGIGEKLTARRAQDRGFELLAQSTPADEPPWIYWYTESAAHDYAGWALLALGQPADAEPHLRRAVSMLDPSFTRDRGLALLNLATARIGMGSVERACATATEAAGIIRRLDSPRGRHRLAEFRATAAPYATSATMKEFDTKHRDLLTPTPT
jgi:tetratricopeptide (TPR) repeat protein